MMIIINNDSLVSCIESIQDYYLPNIVIEKSNTLISLLNPSNIIYDLSQSMNKKVIIFCGNTYICYIINDVIYLDLCHVLCNMNLNECDFFLNLREFSPEIEIFRWMIINNKSIIRRQLINFSTVSKIMLKFDNIYARNYKIASLYFIICLIYVLYNILIIFMFINIF
ncbi:hypothetical protein H012_gp355 [Acanthamoeba polyphaga moumouvirus]|uniref:Uncharacterized protein n=3 Tax=Moumouvirus TaxID=3080801 RepID=L7RCY7_9VIRU|nr:hypothetical protein H012_gp355 [Acanthamoeba polyphaga moumouvirus]AGC02101.1 hypothetical protein Moumou_00573 [Acanthamoeba polyphaga moumouvirus]